MKKPWMPFYGDDYKADTDHLTRAQHASYIFLIWHYWRNGFLPDDDTKLAAIAYCTKREWEKDRPVLKEFFLPGWRHKRIDEELARAEEAHERRVLAGKNGGRPTKPKPEQKSNSKALVSETESNASLRASGCASSCEIEPSDNHSPTQEAQVSQDRGDPRTVVPLRGRIA